MAITSTYPIYASVILVEKSAAIYTYSFSNGSN